MESIDLCGGDSSNRSKGAGIGSIPGMESVVATVSGYHGTERFKLIKLIARTGANYVGAMARSTTHLVCWQFEGMKYDLARKVGAYIISHRWFEDCLKAGKRLPEGPYTMQSGQEAGPITWEVPKNFYTCEKGKQVMSGEQSVLSDKSNDLNFGKAVAISGRNIDMDHLSWSDSHLFNEKLFPSRSSKAMDSKISRKNKGAPEQVRKSSKKVHLDPTCTSLQVVDTSPFPKFCYSSNKRILNNLIQDDVISEPTHRAGRLTKKKAYCSLLKYVSSGKKQETSTGSGDDMTTTIKSNSSLPKSATADCISDEEGSSIRAVVEVEDVEDFRIDHLFKSSGNPRVCNSLSNCELTSEEYCDHISKQVMSLNTGLDQAEQHKEGNDCAAAVHEKSDISCAICWTDFCSTRGVLPCGHRFCYSCIQEWADCMVSKGKVSTCPLCKANFTSITRMEVGLSDQKIFSQTIPCGDSNMDISVVSGRLNDNYGTLLSDPVCYECHSREPEDLLLSCHICQYQWVHSYCLDPPLVPWICSHCREIRVLYQRFR